MRYIFFDVNGVLINGYEEDDKTRKWVKNLERDLGVDPELLTQVFFDRHFDEIILGKKDILKVLKDVLPELGFNGPPKVFLDYWLKHDSEVNEETLNIVKKLKQKPGLRLFMATHQEKNRANHLWNEVGFSNYFEENYFSGRMGVSKYDHRFFDLIENELFLNEEHCLLIDNNPTVIEAATKAGWKTIFFHSPSDLEEVLNLNDE